MNVSDVGKNWNGGRVIAVENVKKINALVPKDSHTQHGIKS